MVGKLLGAKKLDFISQGEPVKGTQIYYSYKADGVDGEMCDRLFLRDGFKVPALKIGATYNLSFNNRGKLESIEPLQQ